MFGTAGIREAEPPQGSWVWVKASVGPTHGDAESPLLCLGKAELNLCLAWEHMSSAKSIESQN